MALTEPGDDADESGNHQRHGCCLEAHHDDLEHASHDGPDVVGKSRQELAQQVARRQRAILIPVRRQEALEHLQGGGSKEKGRSSAGQSDEDAADAFESVENLTLSIASGADAAPVPSQLANSGPALARSVCSSCAALLTTPESSEVAAR